MPLFEGKLYSARELGRNRCGSRRPLFGVDVPIMPSFEPRFSINMQTSLPGQVTTVDQDSSARQIGCGGKGESFRTISAAFPPRSGLVQPCAQAGRAKSGAPLSSTLGGIAEASLRLDEHKQLVYCTQMIQSFADNETEQFFATGRSRRFPPDIRNRAAMRLTQLNAATQIEDLRQPPSNRLEALKGDRKGQWSIRINNQWRVCFKFSKGDAYVVEITDYH